MPMTPRELDEYGEANDLVDDMCATTGVVLTTAERARAQHAVAERLVRLRRKWKAMMLPKPDDDDGYA